jgi:hypothetical protein
VSEKLTFATKPQSGTGESPVKSTGEKAVGETVGEALSVLKMWVLKQFK